MWIVVMLLSVMNVLLAGLVVKVLRGGRDSQEASVHTLASAVDHLMARNNVLMGEIVRHRAMRRSLSGGSCERRAMRRSLSGGSL